MSKQVFESESRAKTHSLWLMMVMMSDGVTRCEDVCDSTDDDDATLMLPIAAVKIVCSFTFLLPI
jgi:hypothetical protein